SSNSLNTTNETITWTEYLDVTTGTLKYGVKNGSSTTWGAFVLGPISVPGTYTSLNQFDPFYVLANSGPLFGAQRIASLNPTAARFYYSNGFMLPIAIPPNCFNLAQMTTAYTK